MPIRDFVRPLLKWWWLIVVATSLAMISTYIAAQRQTLVYEARTTLAVGRTLFDPNPNSNELYLGQQLAGVYANFAQRGQIQAATMEVLGLESLPEHVIRALPNTQFVEITVTDSNPERAQVVTMELANQLILLSPSNLEQDDLERQAFVQDQLDYLEIKIEETQIEIEVEQIELADITSARQIADTQDSIMALQTKLNDLQANYAALLADTQQQATNIVFVIEPATIPSKAAGPSTPLLVALSAVIGFTIGAGAAYLIEYLDDTLQTQGDVERVLGLPTLGYIPRIKRLMPEGASGILLFEDPNSSEAEIFRLLQTSIKFAWGEKVPKNILVTSLGSGDGKTTIAINLAAAFARGGNKVYLVDADLRRPRVHKYVNIPNELGLSDALNENIDPIKMGREMVDSRLRIITSGSPVANPMELFDSIKLLKVLANIKAEADLAIFDGPPLPLPDALVLSSKLEQVIIVLSPGQVREGEAKIVMEQLYRAQSNLLGVVLNRVPRGSGYGSMIDLHGYIDTSTGEKLIEGRSSNDTRDQSKAETEKTHPFHKKTSKSKRSTSTRNKKASTKDGT